MTLVMKQEHVLYLLHDKGQGIRRLEPKQNMVGSGDTKKVRNVALSREQGMFQKFAGYSTNQFNQNGMKSIKK